MSDELHLVIPSIPSVNSMYMNTKFGKRVRTKKAKAWFAEAEDTVRRQMRNQKWHTTQGEKVIVDVYTLFPDARNRDVNNSAKALCDMLEHAEVYDNDRYALVRYIDYDIDREHPRVEIIVRKFDKEKDGWKRSDNSSKA